MLIAIDPGASGAIAYRYHKSGLDGSMGGVSVLVAKMPKAPEDLFWRLHAEKGSAMCGNVKAVVERVGGYVSGNSGPAAVKFARHCGHIDMALIAARIPTEQVAPSVWMKPFLADVIYPVRPETGLKTAMTKWKADKLRIRKNHIKDKMQRLYPHLKVCLWNADALGILTWAINRERNTGS